MQGSDTTESRGPNAPPIQSEGVALEEARLVVGAVGMPQSTVAAALQYGQVQATLAVAEELRALREQLTPEREEVESRA